MVSVIKRLYYNMHWVLAIFLLVYTVVPFLSPFFFHTHHPRLGWWIQTLYKFFCHQRPERSLFLFGEKLWYSLEELESRGFGGGIIGYTFVGNDVLGYKVAICVRDLFLYGSMALTGIIVSLIPRKPRIRWYILAAFLIPMALDGIIQFISEFMFLTQERWNLELAKPFYLSNNETRAVTGLLFGIGIGIFVFSELKEALLIIRNDEQPRQKNSKR